MPKTVHQSEEAWTSLVCPYDLQRLTRLSPSMLCCSFGHEFPITQDIPDLTAQESLVAHLHHVPNRVLETGSYNVVRHSGWRVKGFGRIRNVYKIIQSAKFYKRFVPRALADLDAVMTDRPPVPSADLFTQIYGPGLFAHELLKRLEKELFWDQQTLSHPAMEFGTSKGFASRYFFSDRNTDFGSEYLYVDLIKSNVPHKFRFSANVKFLPFPDDSLETILCSHTVTCVYASIQSVLAEINRVLTPGGRFLFTTHGPAYLRGLPQGWPELGLSVRDCVRRNHQRSSYMAHLYTCEEWRQILAASGFEMVDSRGFLSLDLARYSQLFYFLENGGPNVFREQYTRGRIGIIVRGIFGGEQGYQTCMAQYRKIMQRILAIELYRTASAQYDERSYLDAGIVAIKQKSVSPPLQRINVTSKE